jgi:hypothetical protein
MWHRKPTLVLGFVFVACAQGNGWAQSATPEGLVTLFVAVKAKEGWRVVAGQMTKESPP